MTTAMMPMTTITTVSFPSTIPAPIPTVGRVPSAPVLRRTIAAERPPGDPEPSRPTPANDVHAAWTAGIALLRPWGHS